MILLYGALLLRVNTYASSSVNYSDTFLPPLESLQYRGQGSQCLCWSGTLDSDQETDCRCSGDKLLDVPANISSFVKRLTIAEAAITVLRASSLQPFSTTLTDFTLSDVKYLTELEAGLFQNLTELQTIYIYRAPLLTNILPGVLDVQLQSLKILRIVHTGLKRIPALNQLRTAAPLHMVDFENNQIRRIYSQDVHLRAEQLLLSFNLITRVDDYAFDSSQIAKIKMKGNKKLSVLHEDCFQGLQSLRFLDLSETSITNLPTKGLQELDVLKLQNTRSLKMFPSVYNFKHIREVYLTYPYHCCAFHFPATHHPEEYAKHQAFLKEQSRNCSLRENFSRNISKGNESDFSSSDFLAHASAEVNGLFHDGVTVQPGRRVHALCGNLSKNYGDVYCEPTPDAFNPCEDLMGNWALRVAVWLVAVAALLGNITVLLVLVSSRFRMTVPKFLMCHLAVADLCMGLYLLMIAAVDSRSIGDYFNHAIDWQNGLGCKIAGSLTVFARELSIFTLTVITIERWYTITYAIHLEKRLNLSSAGRIMVCGWLYAIGMAVCPLVGISAYSKTSICLPLENVKVSDLAYLIVLLTFNGLAFWIVCACYGRMYWVIRGGQEAVATLSRSDMTVAKRMALLVFTDFACWAPIAFFGITALAGYPLIDVSNTKILLVFFYPLNSCANPYLYALLTQQYRRDLLVLLSRCGLCSATAARYKGAPELARIRRFRVASVAYHTGGSVVQNNHHRGSVLTTTTSLESNALGSHQTRLNSLQLVPLTVPLHTQRHSKPITFS